MQGCLIVYENTAEDLLPDGKFVVYQNIFLMRLISMIIRQIRF